MQLAAPEPPRLYELTPKSTFADDLPTVRSRLTVEVPTATAGLNSARIALRPTPTTLEYYAGASWIDVVPVMVQNLVLESLDNTGKIDVLGREVVGVRADLALLIHVREFQAEYEGAGPPQVRVRLQARLIRLPRRTSLAATSEEFVVRARKHLAARHRHRVRRGLRQGAQAHRRVDAAGSGGCPDRGRSIMSGRAGRDVLSFR